MLHLFIFRLSHSALSNDPGAALCCFFFTVDAAWLYPGGVPAAAFSGRGRRREPREADAPKGASAGASRGGDSCAADALENDKL